MFPNKSTLTHTMRGKGIYLSMLHYHIELKVNAEAATAYAWSGSSRISVRNIWLVILMTVGMVWLYCYVILANVCI